jgi:hypothetical protein
VSVERRTDPDDVAQGRRVPPLALPAQVYRFALAFGDLLAALAARILERRATGGGRVTVHFDVPAWPSQPVQGEIERPVERPRGERYTERRPS